MATLLTKVHEVAKARQREQQREAAGMEPIGKPAKSGSMTVAISSQKVNASQSFDFRFQPKIRRHSGAMKPVLFGHAGARRLLLLCVLALLSGLPAVAHAHARLLRSMPAGNARLAVAPERAELWFNELLDAEFNGIEIFAASELKAKQRTNLVKGRPVVDAKDRTHLTVELPPLAPGEYVVEWRVLSRDGHSAPGRFTFTVVEPRGR